jgi:hypothetical protein
MSRAARWSLVALCIVLGLLGLSQPDRSPQFSPTTYGETPIGYGAVLAMLTQLGLPAGRTFAPADALPPESTVWWIEPEGLCRARTPAPGAPEVPWTGDAWLAAGGTAVVFLGWESSDECADIAGVAVPGRTKPTRDAATTPEQTVDGPMVSAPHPAGAAAQGLEVGGANVRAMVDGRPFVVATPVGKGTLVLVADAAPLRNRPTRRRRRLTMDLVRAFGVPHIDEPPQYASRRDALRYLLHSAACRCSSCCSAW